MHKAKELLGKAIVNQETGEKVATVRDLMLDNDARRLIAVLVDHSWAQDARVVPWRSVSSIGDVVLVRGDTPIIIASSDPELADQIAQNTRITGTTIINDSGERIGTVGDLFIDDAGEVVGYEVNQGFISSLSGHKFLAADQVQAVGKDAIIADTSELKPIEQAQQDLSESSRHSDKQETSGTGARVYAHSDSKER